MKNHPGLYFLGKSGGCDERPDQRSIGNIVLDRDELDIAIQNKKEKLKLWSNIYK